MKGGVLLPTPSFGEQQGPLQLPLARGVYYGRQSRLSGVTLKSDVRGSLPQLSRVPPTTKTVSGDAGP